jgi:hypothetical protein
MTIFTIDESNNITAFANAEQAAAASTTPFDLFTDQKELAELTGGWPAERLVATYNSLPAVKPVKALKDAKTAASKIWERVEKLGQMVSTEPEAAEPQSEATKPEVAPAKAEGRQKGQGSRTGAQGRAGEGEGKQEGHRREGCAQSQKRREEGRIRRSARRQQDGRSYRNDAAEERRHNHRDHERDGLAAA